jgi:hypothetical protein
MSQEITTPTETPTETPQPTEAPQVVAAEAYERVKADMLKYKKEREELAKMVDTLKVNTHKEKEDWKSVAQIHEEKARDLEQKYSGLKDSLVRDRKVAKLTEEALKHGINPASLPDLELLDFDEMSVETTSTGKILVSGQDRAIAKLKVLRPHWFTKTVPGVNPTTPETGRPNGLVTLADVNLAEAQYRKTKSEADKKAYYDVIQKYKTQPGG